MRIPLIPVAVLLLLTGAGIAVLTLTGPTPRRLGVPIAGALSDVDGVETEVAIAPDGLRYALIASGNLWYVDLGGDAARQLTDTDEPESAPAWTGDGERITFSRGPDTLEIDPADGAERPRLSDARELATWRDEEGNERIAFIREQSLWVGGAGQVRQLVPADPATGAAIRSPRFSPGGGQILFLKSWPGPRGEVWRVDLATGDAFPVIADRPAENPTSAEWVGDGRHLVYLTDRSGGLAVWYVDLESATLHPLTEPMMARSPVPLGLDVHGTRVVVPRLTLDSDVVTSRGELIAGGAGLQMEPAITADGSRIAFTQEAAGGFEIWMVERSTGERRHLAFGRSPRFSPDGNHVVYAATDLDGNRNLWKVDVRTGLQEALTDGAGLDEGPDWSPDGRMIVFSSSRGGPMVLQTAPASGGRRRALGAGGHRPRFSPDGRMIAFWADGAIYTTSLDALNVRRIAEAHGPAPPVWSDAAPFFFGPGGIRSSDGLVWRATMWPEFEATGDGEWLISEFSIEASELWSIELTFGEE